MTILQALVLALIQGLTELFPVSSLGHAVIVPALLHWSLDERGLTFLPFLVMLHVGTAAALLCFFWRDWLALGRGAIGAANDVQVRESRHIIRLIVIASVPAVVVGYVFESILRTLFGTPQIAAIFLTANGMLLLLTERLRRRNIAGADRPIAALSVRDALVVGLCQCIAFLPGISRSGATIAGGLLRGFSHQVAARFSFLIALPIILAATASQLMKLKHAHVSLPELVPAFLGAVVAGITAWCSTAFLMRYFSEHEAWALRPFAIYCVLAGLGSLVLLHLV